MINYRIYSYCILYHDTHIYIYIYYQPSWLVIGDIYVIFTNLVNFGVPRNMLGPWWPSFGAINQLDVPRSSGWSLWLLELKLQWWAWRKPMKCMALCKEHRSRRVLNCMDTMDTTVSSYLSFYIAHILWSHNIIIWYMTYTVNKIHLCDRQRSGLSCIVNCIVSEAVADHSASEGLGTGAKPRGALRRHRDGLTTSETTRWMCSVKTLWWMEECGCPFTKFTVRLSFFLFVLFILVPRCRSCPYRCERCLKIPQKISRHSKGRSQSRLSLAAAQCLQPIRTTCTQSLQTSYRIPRHSKFL